MDRKKELKELYKTMKPEKMIWEEKLLKQNIEFYNK